MNEHLTREQLETKCRVLIKENAELREEILNLSIIEAHRQKNEEPGQEEFKAEVAEVITHD